MNSSVKKFKELLRSSNNEEMLAHLCRMPSKWDDYILQLKYSQLVKGLFNSNIKFKPLRIAILSTTTITHFSEILILWLAKDGFNAEIYESEFDTIDQEILDPESGLYRFKPDIALLFTHHRDIKLKTSLFQDLKEINSYVDNYVKKSRQYWSILHERLNCFVIQNNIDLPLERSLGNFETSVKWSKLSLFKKINEALLENIVPGVAIFDIDHLSAVYGKRNWYQQRLWYHSKHSFAPDAYGFVAHALSKLIRGIKGQAHKCLVLDLDNTLWGGVIGDDGLENIVLGHGSVGEAYVDFQNYLLELKKRGVILCICSKNEHEAAQLPFLKHPDMKITLDDITIFKANWKNKAKNIEEISNELNIGLDSIVFIDDSNFERELVRSTLPMVTVPEMPNDPANYIYALDQERYFETISISEEDQKRGDLYRDNVNRAKFEYQCQSVDDYLQRLGMVMSVGHFDKFHLPRITQLINKSNQFHLTTTRYNESQISGFMNNQSYETLYYCLQDKYGDNGLISAVILERISDGNLIIDTWVMSCRVLSRGTEEFILNDIVFLAKSLQIKKITGRYIPTSKNGLVKELYKKLGFQLVLDKVGSTTWELAVGKDLKALKTYIKRQEDMSLVT